MGNNAGHLTEGVRTGNDARAGASGERAAGEIGDRALTRRGRGRDDHAIESRSFVAARMKELRREGGITQQRFALMTGLNRSYLADIEMGNRNFGIDTLDRIVTGFGISYAEFFSGL